MTVSDPASATPDDPEDNVRCSLIVLNFEERELLLACVASILAAIGPTDEVIVVDNGSTDGSAEAIAEKYPSVRIVRNRVNRYIFGLNDGLQVARGTYVAFCNNDMVVETNFVEGALRCFNQEDVFAVCSRVLDGHGAEQGSRTAGYWKHGLLFYQSLPHNESMTNCFFAVGGQSFFRHDILQQLGSIDELLWPMYHEDIELSYRAWRCGYRIVYAPESVCNHLGSRTSQRVFKPVELRSFVRQNELLTVWKDVSDRRMLIQHFLWSFPRLMMAFVRWDSGTLVGSWHALGRLPGALKARHATQHRFTRTDRDVLRRVGLSAINQPLSQGIPED
jgi:GT2 family glycosyltransferase